MKKPIAPIVALSLLLFGCGKPSETPVPPRPVRTVVLAPVSPEVRWEFPGEVRARVESKLAFRVPGKLLERPVQLGQTVKAGQRLARLDATDLQLAQNASRAQLDAATSERDLAKVNFSRFEELFKQNFISQAEFDRRKVEWQAAQARFDQAQAALSSQSNQTRYAELVADVAGVVTAVEAEPGQVVSAGQTIARVARTNSQQADKEVSLAVPEDRIAAVRALQKAQVSLAALPGQTFSAQVREVAAAADPATRTYAVRLALPKVPDAVELGMTATAYFTLPAPQAFFRVPLSALLERDAKTWVWVVDEKSRTVQLQAVQVAGPADNDVLIASGLQAGQRVVTAGVHLLQAGQTVSLLEAPL
jgi:RND family efflux transporter MFP subunit